MPNYCTYPQALELFEAVDQAKQDTLIAGAGISIAPDGKTISAPSGSGDMLKSVYDTDNDGIVDKAETLNDGANALSATIPELNYVHGVTGSIQTQLNGKQGTLTFDNVPTKNSANPVKSGGVYDAIGAKAPISLLKDTVGWVGKNKIPATLDIVKSINTLGTWNGNVYTRRGNTFTVNLTNDGYIDNVVVGGTNDGTGEAVLALVYEVRDYLEVGNSYFYSGCPSGGSASTYGLNVRYYGYEYGSGKNFTLANQSGNIWYGIVVFKDCPQLNNIVFKPFLIDADITDHTYAPYHPPVSDVITDVYGVMGENGALNILPRQTFAAQNGVTPSIDANGVITATGTASANYYKTFAFTNFTLKAGTYTFGLIDDNTSLVGDYTIQDSNNQAICQLYFNRPNERTKTFTLANDTVVKQSGLYVKSGESASSLKISPYLYLGQVTDKTFYPYAMTNRELTDAVTLKTGTLTLETGLSSNDVHVSEKSGIVSVSGVIYNASLTYAAFTHVATVSGVSLPKSGESVRFPVVTSEINPIPVVGKINSLGQIEIYLYGNTDYTLGSTTFNFTYMV